MLSDGKFQEKVAVRIQSVLSFYVSQKMSLVDKHLVSSTRKVPADNVIMKKKQAPFWNF